MQSENFRSQAGMIMVEVRIRYDSGNEIIGPGPFAKFDLWPGGVDCFNLACHVVSSYAYVK